MSSSDSSASSSKSATPRPQPEIKKLKRKRKEPAQEVVSESSDSDDSGDEHEAEDGVESSPTSIVEEPVLSHAERRRRKKEAKLAAKLESTKEEGTAVKKRKLKDGSAKNVADSTSKRQNSVWVGNMSFKTTIENLRTFFKECGEITRINMPTKAPTGPGVKPENRGFAYVDFATPEAKTAAIALSEKPLVGRKLLIKDGDDFAGRPAAVGADITINDPALAHKTHSKTAQKILRAQKQPPAPTLFFGNLGFETTDAAIRELLEAHRPAKKPTKDPDTEVEGGEKEKAKDIWIRKVRMGTFEDSGLCKGFAFVDFTSIEHATAALINSKNHHLNGRTLVVEYAGADAVRRGAPKSAKPVDKPEHKGRGGRRPPRADNPRYRTDRPRKNIEEQPETVETVVTTEPKKAWDGKNRAAKSDKLDGARHKGPKTRPKPGAALALAKRESVAIVPSEGKKITF